MRMRDSVRAAFSSFTERFEARIPWMYLDNKGLVTIGLGFLIDSPAAAYLLPFKYASDHLPASKDVIWDEWRHVKARQDLKHNGGFAFRDLTCIRLSDATIDGLLTARLAQMEAHLVARFPDYPTWPADAQLGLLSMSWAMGADFHFPKFQAAATVPAFAVMADECKISAVDNPQIKPRNLANRVLFMNAAEVILSGSDPDVLHYPASLSVPLTP